MFDSTPNPLPLFLRRVIPPFLFFFFPFRTAMKKKFERENGRMRIRMVARARESRKRKTAQLRNTGKICSARDRF